MTDKRRIPTIIDVAREAGVSKSAASRALLGQSEVSPATIERVQAAAQALGYVPNAMARGLVEQRTNIIGVHVRDASNVFYAAMLGAMHARAVTHGYRLISTSGTWKLLVDEEVEALSTLVSLRVDGIIVCSSALPAEHIVPVAGRIPTVVTGRPEVDPRLSAIYVDEVHGGRSMARHIVSLGHHRIGVVMEAAAQSISQHARSEAMVAELRRKPGGDRLPVTIGDMATTRVGSDYRLVYLVYNTITNLLTQDEQVECFRTAAEQLAPGGAFVIEVFVPQLRRMPPGQYAVPFHVGERHLGLDTVDVVTQRLVSHHFTQAGVDSGGRRLATYGASAHRYVWPSELDLMARLAGLTLRDRWADWTHAPFTAESDSHVSVWAKGIE